MNDIIIVLVLITIAILYTFGLIVFNIVNRINEVERKADRALDENKVQTIEIHRLDEAINSTNGYTENRESK